MILARLAEAASRPVHVAILLGAAETLREAAGLPLDLYFRSEHDGRVAAARAALGEEAFTAAWAAGRAMPREQAVRVALEEAADA